LFIDELTSKLHPLLTRALIEIFNNAKQGKNGKPGSKGQLIFTCHDTNILTNQFFRRDQIWFTQKDKYGATELYSLDEYKVRKDASFNKDYIMGKYGAIPFIGDIESLFEDCTNEA
jgi:AAA15 family ATPase/GTPase